MDALFAGEVGYLAASIKQVADARVGDTITLKKEPAAEALPGYAEAMPMVFCGLFPTGECGWVGGWACERVCNLGQCMQRSPTQTPPRSASASLPFPTLPHPIHIHMHTHSQPS